MTQRETGKEAQKALTKALGAAARAGDVGLVGEHIATARKSGLKVQSSYAFSAAGNGGSLDVLRLLRSEIGSDIFHLDEALASAAMSGHPEAVRVLHEWGATDLAAALSLAIAYNNIETVRLLLELGAPADKGIATAALGRHPEALLVLHERAGPEGHNAALRAAAAGGQPDAVVQLLGWGASDVEGALLGAAKFGHLDVMKIMHDQGAANLEAAYAAAAQKDKVDAMELLHAWSAEPDTKIHANAVMTAQTHIAREADLRAEHHAERRRLHKYQVRERSELRRANRRQLS